MNSQFPEEDKIPEKITLRSVDIGEYLVKGELCSWKGPFHQVVSPVCFNTASGSRPDILGSYPLVTQTESMAALDAAREAFDDGRGEWPSMPVDGRIRHFRNFTRRMKRHRNEIASLIMWETGKSREDSFKEFDRTITYINDTIKALKREERDSKCILSSQGIRGRVRRIPLGTALCMGPYNYPLYETFTAIAPALLTGNTVVCKPPRYGALLFGPLLGIFRDVFPGGTVNIIFGDGKEIVPPLMESGKVDVLAFIGTSKVAAYLKHLHPKPHRLRSLLGLEAKNPAFILPDADLNKAVKESLMGALAFNGQRCAAIKIIFVHSAVANDFVRRLSAEMTALKCGMPWEEGVNITPLTEPHRMKYLADLIEDATKKGARVMNDGGGFVEGVLFHPALLYPANARMRIYHEEQFGPVVPVVPYDDVEMLCRNVIESDYGQQASIFGDDPAAIKELTDVLMHHVSRININSKCQRTPDTFPFSGRKDSAEGVLSVLETIRAFTTPVVVTARETDRDSALLADVAGD